MNEMILSEIAGILNEIISIKSLMLLPHLFHFGKFVLFSVQLLLKMCIEINFNH